MSKNTLLFMAVHWSRVPDASNFVQQLHGGRKHFYISSADHHLDLRLISAPRTSAYVFTSTRVAAHTLRRCARLRESRTATAAEDPDTPPLEKHVVSIETLLGHGPLHCRRPRLEARR